MTTAQLERRRAAADALERYLQTRDVVHGQRAAALLDALPERVLSLPRYRVKGPFETRGNPGWETATVGPVSARRRQTVGGWERAALGFPQPSYRGDTTKAALMATRLRMELLEVMRERGNPRPVLRAVLEDTIARYDRMSQGA
jgi:hypothetical protein